MSLLSFCRPGRTEKGRWAWGAVLLLIAMAAPRGLVCAAEPAWQKAEGYRWSRVQPQGIGRPGFTLLTNAALGIMFTNAVQEDRTITNRNLGSGSGVALGDVDGDGWCDIFLCGIDVSPRLYRNRGGWRFEEVTRERFAVDPGSGPGSDATGTAFADIDGDGDLDLLVNGFGRGTRLWLNDGKGRFQERTDEAGLRSRTGATSLALADVDGDGDLDLYVCNFRPDTVMDQPGVKFGLRNIGGRPVVIAMDGRPTTAPDLTNRFEVGAGGQVVEYGEPDVLWLNEGSARFRPVSWTGGVFVDEDGQPFRSPERDWGLAAQFGDLDGDGRMDLYVCNDLHTPDRLWMNRSTPGKPRFEAIPRLALRNNSTFSMGVDFGDLNRDGFTDFFTVDMLARERSIRARQMSGLAPQFRRPGEFQDRVQLLRNALQWNRGDTTFAETGIFSGVEASDWSWGPIFLDVDLDGFEDILVTNGQLRDYQDSDAAERVAAAQAGGRTLTPADILRLNRELPRFATANALFHNRTPQRIQEAGASPVVPGSPVVPVFVERASEWGFATVGISQGAAVADLDQDGDLDVVMNNLLEGPGIYRNEATAPRVAIRLQGRGGNSKAIGSRISVTIPAAASPFPKDQSQNVIAGGRYLSGDESLRTFAAGTSPTVDVTVRWPSGRLSRHERIPANSVVELDEPSVGEIPKPPTIVPVGPIRFEDVSDRLRHVAADAPFDDGSRQPLLPNALGQLGPGVSWADWNGDGFPDLVVGAGRSGSVGLFENDQRGGFRRVEDPGLSRPLGRDLTTILPLGANLLAGSSHWEDGQTNGGMIRVYDIESRRSGEAVLGVGFAVGPLAAADLDGDGALEVFVGGRARAGRWPEPVPSVLLRDGGGRFAVAERFDAMGRVSGACFSDVDGDGDSDLVVVGDWGPIQIWRNDKGRLSRTTPSVLLGGERMPLDRFSGLWNSVTAGDFDGDGRLDLVAGNWGLNNSWIGSLPPAERPSILGMGSPPRPLRRLYWGAFGGATGFDLVEALPGSDGDLPARELPMWSRAFPWIREAVPTYAAFGTMTIAQVFGTRLADAQVADITWLASTLLLNRGDHWEVRPLPDVAQLSPVFGLAVADADGDGAEDLFLAQNWSHADPLTARVDAGRGLWLRGDGRGGFRSELQTGVAVYGDQRGAAVADFDRDGRPDLVVAQNGASTHLLRNVAARPGLRVGVEDGGVPGSWAGTTVRLVFGDRSGPWREWHLGAGYWSVDSVTQILALPTTATAVEVRRPGGAILRHPLQPGVTAIVVTPDGQIRTSP
jgi:hypothetical protein